MNGMRTMDARERTWEVVSFIRGRTGETFLVPLKGYIPLPRRTISVYRYGRYGAPNAVGRYGAYNVVGRYGAYNVVGRYGAYNAVGRYGAYNAGGRYGAYNVVRRYGAYNAICEYFPAINFFCLPRKAVQEEGSCTKCTASRSKQRIRGVFSDFLSSEIIPPAGEENLISAIYTLQASAHPTP
ncbi:hypothetical protein B0H16DRAFT_678976 [Mycena metata]|uniref:Uncharacterized protein n=1 Tax=Mycena metata TaxID=1033252 RepID=A0AAD7J4S8_9AGAR|nr:hypothetical protein B0H16DRAFT_678976 [Mycena metata]